MFEDVTHTGIYIRQLGSPSRHGVVVELEECPLNLKSTCIELSNLKLFFLCHFLCFYCSFIFFANRRMRESKCECVREGECDGEGEG
jgi:hypothetical protein